MARGGSYHFSCFVFYDFGISQSIKALDQDPIFLVVWAAPLLLSSTRQCQRVLLQVSNLINFYRYSLLNGDQ